MVERVLHAPMPFTTGGQTISDRLNAAKHSITGSQLGKSVSKATTEEVIGPKKKHLDYLLHCTHEPNVSIPQLANFLVERTQNTNWCVVFKSLVTIHNLMCYGNERFSQYLASSNANLDLNNFLDKTTVQGYDMSTHIRRYAKYISEKIYTYRLMAFDFCKVKRGKDDGLLRTMHTEKLLKTLPILQQQIDALLEFQITPAELTNGVINSVFILLFRDLIRLFACYNDGIINLLEKYFDMNKKQAREAFDMYKSFLLRMEKVSEFLKTAESVGIDRGEIPDLAKAPNSLLEALEQHLMSLEGTKGSGSRMASPTSGSAPQMAQTAINALSSMTDVNFVDPSILDEQTKQKYLADEEAALNALKEQRLRDGGANPFLPNSSAADIGVPSLLQGESATEDLLSLNFAPSQTTTSAPTNPFLATNGATSPASSIALPSVPLANALDSAVPDTVFASDETFAQAFASVNGHHCPQPIAPECQNGNRGISLSAGDFGAGSTPAPPSRTITPMAPLSSAAMSNNPFASSTDPDSMDMAWDAAVASSGSGTVGMDSDAAWGANFGSQDPNSAVVPENPFMSGGQEVDSSPEMVQEPHSAFQSTFQDFGVDHGGFGAAQSTAPALGSGAQPTGTDEGNLGHYQLNVSASSSLAPSPSPSPIPQCGTSPMNIPIPSNIYQHTPFSKMDASYTSSPQMPRHPMGALGTPSPSGQMSSSYTPGGFMGTTGVQQHEGTQRPPSAPATELAGLDPLADFLSPSPTPGGTPSANTIAAPGVTKSQKLIKNDLDSSLASLALNLNISKGQQGVAQSSQSVQWTGRGGGFTGQAPYGAGQWQQQHYPMPNQGYSQSAWGMQPMAPMGGNMMPQMPYGQQRPMMYPTVASGHQAGFAQQNNQQQQFDPFGAL